MRACTILLLAGLLPALLSAQTTRPLNEQDPTTSSFNLYNGIATIRGWRFVVNGPNVTVVELGCRYPDSNINPKTITLWAMAPTPTALGSVTITPGPGWRWANLATPIPLTQSAEYTVSAYSPAQMYENNNLNLISPTAWRPTGTIQYLNMQWQNTPTAPTNFPGSNYGSNSQQGVVDIGYVQGPQLTVNATAGTAQNVFNNAQGIGGTGLPVGTFTIGSNSEPGAVLQSIQVSVQGTGNDATAFSHVAVHRDSNDNSQFDPATDTLIGSAASGFASDNGSLTFNVQVGQDIFPTSETRRYFIVVKLAGTALGGHTFNFTVSQLGVGGSTLIGGVPSAVMNGLVVTAPVFTFADASQAAPATAFIGSTGNVCQTFTLTNGSGPDNKPATITVNTLGTGHDVNHIAAVRLWLDANANGTFEPALDTLIDTTAFSADNGQAVFDLALLPNLAPAIPARFFVAYDFNLSAQHQQTFKCYVSAASGALYAATYVGLPAPALTGTPGLVIDASLLTATLHGPGSPQVVANNAIGSTGDGVMLADVSLAAAGGQPWDLGGLVFRASGTGAHDAAFSELGLYEDTGNGVFDGSSNDQAAAPALTGFGPGPAFEAVFTLTAGQLAPGTSRRFFLVGKLAGTASTAQTFNARLHAISGTPPAGGVQQGLPGADSTALVIASAVLTVRNAPGSPADMNHVSGTSLVATMARFRMTAANDDITVSGINLVTTGNGNWATSFHATEGVRVYLEDGDGVFGASDTLLFSGAGAATVNVLFATSQLISNGQSLDLWVRIHLLDTAGTTSSVPQTYSLTIPQASDVSASAMVLLGTPAPQGAILTVMNFAVTAITPLEDVPAGGKPISITGTGFVAPVTVRIGGVVCPGTALVTPTSITGLLVPPGSGSNLAITVTSGSAPALTLTQTFTYIAPQTAGGAASSGGGCLAAAGGGICWLVPLALAARRRRR